MPCRTHDDLLRTLGRGELAPVYYLCGAEDVLKDEAVRAIVDRALEPHERDFNLDTRGAQRLPPEELHALVNTLPMMANRRVVIVRDIEVWKKKTAGREVLLAYLQNPNADTVLVLVEGAPDTEKDFKWAPDEELTARSFGVNCEALKPDRVVKWIGWHAKRLGLTFAEGAAEHLAQATHYDLGTLRAELEKFATLAGQGPVSREQVGDLVGIHHGETLDDWVESVLAGDVPRAVRLTPQVLDQAGMTGVKMVTALGTTLTGVALARALRDGGAGSGALQKGLWEKLKYVRPFGIGNWSDAVNNWSRWSADWPAPRIRAAQRVALAADRALKGTRVSDEAGVVAGMVLEVVK